MVSFVLSDGKTLDCQHIFLPQMVRLVGVLVGFNERQTTTLTYGKPLIYEGRLYSEEHNRSFTTERAGFQVVKDPADKSKLILVINRQSIGEWFREQFDRLRQSVRQPIQPQRKNRGMKL